MHLSPAAHGGARRSLTAALTLGIALATAPSATSTALPGPNDSAPRAAEASRGGGAAGADDERPSASTTADEALLRVDVIAAVAAGDYETARELIDSVLVERYLGHARAELLQDPPRPENSLLWLDRAQAIRRRDPELQLLRAESNLLLAESLIDQGANGIYIEGAFQDALVAFQEALPRTSQRPRALFGASRAAYMLNRSEEALNFAEEGMEALDAGASADGLRVLPERTLTEAAYLTYREVKREGADEERARELFQLTERSLDRLLGRSASDPWVWRTLADLYAWEGRADDALSALQRGLDRRPDDAGLLERLADLARGDGDFAASLEVLEAFLARHPDVPAGHFRAGRERFELAVGRLLDGETAPDLFEGAERSFQRARELEPELEADCLGYEVMCRNGVSWCAYNAGELERAREGFLSMNELFPGGITWHLPERLLSGIAGLQLVADAHGQAGDLGEAAEVFDQLRELQPDEVQWANNAGFFHRDAATALESAGRHLCRAAADGEAMTALRLERLKQLAGLPENFDGDLQAAFRAAAEAKLERAREGMRQSLDAYADAVELAPEDVRILNDTALIIIYYVPEDLERAEELLRRSVAAGTEQLESEELDADARWELLNAWGDAYQNLGFLDLVNRNDPAAAKPFFEKAVEIGPDPRPFVSELLLPLCDLPPEETAHNEQLLSLRQWGAPCTPPK